MPLSHCLPAEISEQVVELYSAGLSLAEVAKRLRIGRASVGRILHRFEVPTRPRVEAIKEGLRKRRERLAAQ